METVKNWDTMLIVLDSKYNIPDLFATIGIEQLVKVNEFNAKRQIIAKYYDEFFNQYPDFYVIQKTEINVINSRSMYPISLVEKVRLNDFISYMQLNGIQVSVLFAPIYQFSYYRDKYHLKRNEFPMCEDFALVLVCLPIYPLLTINEVEFICSKIKNYTSRK